MKGWAEDRGSTSIVYLIFGCLWILISDKVLYLMTAQDSLIEGGQTLKGVLFVVLSSVLIFFTVRYESRRRFLKERELHKTRNEAKESAFKAEEEERNRISSELHDGIQQELAGISLMVERTKEEKNSQDLEEVKKEVDNCIEEIRSISHDLSSLHLDQKGLVKALDDLYAQNKNSEPVEIRTHTKAIHEPPLSYFAALNIYRISQELLLNVSKHSSTEGVEISVQKQKDGPFLYRFQEDTPCRKGSKGVGIGERTIQKRIDSLDGEILSVAGPEEVDKPFTFSFWDRGTLQELDKEHGDGELRLN